MVADHPHCSFLQQNYMGFNGIGNGLGNQTGM